MTFVVLSETRTRDLAGQVTSVSVTLLTQSAGDRVLRVTSLVVPEGGVS